VNLLSETQLRIQVKELLFSDAYLCKVVDDKILWFMGIQIVNPIYHQLFFVGNSSGCQATTCQYVQPLALQTLALAAADMHCALSEFASGKMATVMISQDKYQGTFCPSPVANFTPEATALINHTLVGHFELSPPCSATPLG